LAQSSTNFVNSILGCVYQNHVAVINFGEKENFLLLAWLKVF